MQRALIVIDVQNEYVTGNLPIGYPDVGESLDNIAAAMDAATGAGVPVVVVQHAAPENSPIFARGSEGFALHPTVAGRPFDHLVEKALASSFDGTDLADWLAAKGVDTLTIAGYMTQNCDESTARDAASRGLTVEFLSDATGTLAMSNNAGSVSAEELHRHVLVVMATNFASVVTTDEWIGALHKGEPLECPNLIASTEAGREEAVRRSNARSVA
ncbi:cysteine hydrolase family protein [Streptomyces tsukubensis]|uniref:Cysteine hydrolase n=1 Tax=Streptomyces tsukubensis TaxID=83656 RepID=A0A1V4A366_9ACTN|nr:cysteine hydrolase family protein [Streptomyces tsukubensis]OON74201.1 cysteine hydrolase [Streptomyces tsukubensis]QFR95277.1 isochorismatase family protein [Streptomyces tsukubensis]